MCIKRYWQLYNVTCNWSQASDQQSFGTYRRANYPYTWSTHFFIDHVAIYNLVRQNKCFVVFSSSFGLSHPYIYWLPPSRCIILASAEVKADTGYCIHRLTNSEPVCWSIISNCDAIFVRAERGSCISRRTWHHAVVLSLRSQWENARSIVERIGDATSLERANLIRQTRRIYTKENCLARCCNTKPAAYTFVRINFMTQFFLFFGPPSLWVTLCCARSAIYLHDIYVDCLLPEEKHVQQLCFVSRWTPYVADRNPFFFWRKMDSEKICRCSPCLPTRTSVSAGTFSHTAALTVELMCVCVIYDTLVAFCTKQMVKNRKPSSRWNE